MIKRIEEKRDRFVAGDDELANIFTVTLMETLAMMNF